MIEVRGVVKSFGKIRAVRGASFDAPRGSVVGLLGANGAGKTTTIRIITGFLPPDAGSARIAGRDVVDDSRAARRQIGYLPESAPSYGEMRTIDFLNFRARLYGLGRAPRRAAAERVVEQCWLGEVRHRRIGHLSKGYRQRVGLAAALIHDPPVLILDEPTNGLDPRQIREVRALIRDLAATRTVLVSSHILPEIEVMCDRVVIMAQGRVRADGTPAALVASHAGHAPCVVEVQTAPAGGAEAIGAIFRAVPGAAHVERMEGPGPDGFCRFRVTPRADAGDLREAIARAAQRAGCLVRELRAQTPTLEQVFLAIMETDA